MEKTVSHKVVLPCAVQCLLECLDICFIELFWCQAIKTKLVTAKVWPKGGPESGSVLRRQKWSCKNKYIISAYDSGRAHFWGHETDPKVAPLFCPQSFAERPESGSVLHFCEWPRYFAHKALQRGAATDASSIEVRDTAYRTQAATKRTREDLSMADGFGFDFRRRKLHRS